MLVSWFLRTNVAVFLSTDLTRAVESVQQLLCVSVPHLNNAC